jgi:hypothetical protein
MIHLDEEIVLFTRDFTSCKGGGDRVPQRHTSVHGRNWSHNEAVSKLARLHILEIPLLKTKPQRYLCPHCKWDFTFRKKRLTFAKRLNCRLNRAVSVNM